MPSPEVPIYNPTTEPLFQGQCEHCAYTAVATTFEQCCNDLTAHLQEHHLEALHKVYAQALSRAVVQAIKCVA